MAGPLTGVRVIELAGIGPAPFAAMLLADHGAQVIRVERPGAAPTLSDVTLRSREIVTLDLKSDEGRERLLALAATADVLIEGFRPGTIEKLGIGPDVLLAQNPRLVIGRMTGWGQTGSLARAAGHDLNYIALCGALEAIGPKDGPIPPLALVGDFGGGGMMLAFSIASALLHSRAMGQGQVIDCAISDGANLLMAMFYGLRANGMWNDRRMSNLTDGAAHFYNCYETADGKFVSVASVEPQFYAILLDRLGLAGDPEFARQMDEALWPRLRQRMAAIFRQKSREEWCRLLEGSDACFAPVLSMAEAPGHVTAGERGTYVTLGGVVQPAPAPRYSATPLDPPRPSSVLEA